MKAARGIELDADRLPLDDPRTYQLLSEARTLGVFQLESQGMRDALQRLRPERIEDIIAMVALYRPGPMDLIPDFVNRKHGRAEITYEHPAMERHLQETYGIMVYQEQVMRLAADLAGFSLGPGRHPPQGHGQEGPRAHGRAARGVREGLQGQQGGRRKAERIWDLIEKFAGYGFNKCHAACYGLVAYQTAYLKANYPVEFMAALLTSEMERTDKIVQYIEECRAMGLRVAPPDVNRSGARFTVDGDTIRFGLAAIKNVGETAIESIMRCRREAGGLLLARRLLRAGRPAPPQPARAREPGEGGRLRRRSAPRGRACSPGSTRPWRRGSGGSASATRGRPRSSTRRGGARGGRAGRRPQPSCRSGRTEQLLGYEKEVLGFYLSGHPLERYRDRARELGTASAAEWPPPGGRARGAAGPDEPAPRARHQERQPHGLRLAGRGGRRGGLTIFPEALKTCGPRSARRGPCS